MWRFIEILLELFRIHATYNDLSFHLTALLPQCYIPCVRKRKWHKWGKWWKWNKMVSCLHDSSAYKLAYWKKLPVTGLLNRSACKHTVSVSASQFLSAVFLGISVSPQKSREANRDLQIQLDQVLQQAQDPNSRGNSLFAEVKTKLSYKHYSKQTCWSKIKWMQFNANLISDSQECP